MGNTIRKLDWLWEVSVREIYVILAVVSPVGGAAEGRSGGLACRKPSGLTKGWGRGQDPRGRWEVAELAARLRCCQNIQVGS